ncbi:MAG: RHS repeat-associated core domain-containing protein [Chitinophagaceae bacterium]
MMAILPARSQEVQKDGGLVYRTELSVFKGTSDDPGGAFKSLLDNSFASLQCPAIPGEILAKRKIVNTVMLKLDEATTNYIPNNFDAKLKVRVKFGPGVSDYIDQDLEINYTKEEGAPYKAKQYLKFEDKTDVTVTILGFVGTEPTFTGFNIRDILSVENSMIVTRYFNLVSPNVDPSVFLSADLLNAAFVRWEWPVGTGNNYTQLEWTFLPNDLNSNYFKPNTNEIDFEKLFEEGTTRIDLPSNISTYIIRYNFESYGQLFIRVRPVNLTPAGREDGKWSNVSMRPADGHDGFKNWQSVTTYAEEGKSMSAFNYFDGSLRIRQSLSRNNQNGKGQLSETMYDLQGRPSVQVLPAVGHYSGFVSNLNMFEGQDDDKSPVDFFDLEPIGQKLVENAQKGAAGYYSNLNENNYGVNRTLPKAEGYAYSLTRYTPDNTGRILSQSGVGEAFKAGGGHETKYFYGTAAQEELDGLFGTDVGNNTHYAKSMVKDANGQLSVSYIDMHGRTIATALAGATPGNLISLPYNDPSIYHNQGGKQFTRNLLDPTTNIAKGNSIESINTLLVPEERIYSFEYKLTPQTLQSDACANAPAPFICHDCLYDLEIAIIPEDDDSETPPLIKKYSNVSFEHGTACDGNYPALVGADDNIAHNVISIPVNLAIGSYTIRKTLVVNEASLQRYKELWLAQKTCETFEQIRQSIYNSMLSISDCDNPAPNAECSECLVQLGDYANKFRPEYLASIGHSGVVSAELELQMQQAFAKAAQTCQEICSPGAQILASKREMMLADITPGGQYAKLPAVTNSSNPMHKLYDIFSTQNVSRPKEAFKLPLNIASGQPGTYNNVNGTPDADINSAQLDQMNGDDFANLFKPEWANSLLRYHPEYPRLEFAETTLQNAYTWINDFRKVTGYDAAPVGYFAPHNTDPLYSAPNSAAIKSTMTGWVISDYHQGLSLWQLARGQVKCKGISSNNDRLTCYQAGGTKIPPFADVTTTPDKDEVWVAFRDLYSSVREQQLNGFIAQERPLSNQTQLVTNNYTIRFQNNVTAGALPGGNFIPGVPGTLPVGTPSTYPPSIADPYLQAGCEAHVPDWEKTLLECNTIAQHPNSAAIVTAIINGMLDVCSKGSDILHPNGASTVAPSTPNDGSPRSFAEVIQRVFTTYSISYTDLCNPFMFEFPTPYEGPALLPQPPAGSDACVCEKFKPIETAATNAGYHPDNLTSLNQYLTAAYGQTISQEVFERLAGCWEGRTNTGTPLDLPVFLQCEAAASSCISCASLSSLIQEFKSTFTAPYNSAPILTQELTQTDISYNTLLARFLNVKTGNSFTWGEYLGAAQSAGCDLSTLSLNLGGGTSGFPADISINSRSGNTPAEYVATQTINFLPGFESGVDDQFTAVIASANPANQLVLCPRPPAWQIPGNIIMPSPCQRIFEMADALATQIFERRKEVLLAEFDQNYRAKCLDAGESFTVSYTNSEYHYTLYYYDMAGNLVKTVPPKGVKPNFDPSFLASVRNGRENNLTVRPEHILVTDYRYNSLGKVVTQQSPDGGNSQFWYDDLGRLVVSQNAEQAYNNRFSYTMYDDLGRIVEVGQKHTATAMTQAISQDKMLLKNWITGTGAREELTVTHYDHPYGNSDVTEPSIVLQDGFNQQNMRGRVSYSYNKAQFTDLNYHSASFYTYDIHGNVDILLQDYRGIAAMNGNTFKRIEYDYDLISGKVNEVAYQPDFYNGQGWTINPDKFFHRYTYDSENRLTTVLTSRDRINWERDAAYEYFDHGGLARTVMGEQSVQGLDYSYTLQGWLKGVNSTSPGNPAYDPGSDGSGIQNYDGSGARDVFGFALHYYDNGSGNLVDYKSISGMTQFARPGTAADIKSLYNGNIAAMSVNIAALQKAGGGVNAEPLLYKYRYDQLHRIKSMTAYNGLSNNVWTPVQLPNQAYAEATTYDPNGNILTYNRNGSGANPMDQLTYNYEANNNRLTHVDDAVMASNYAGKDIQDQDAGNYEYDRIGNMKKDVKEGITNITWSVYGKINSIYKNNSPTPSISYTYDFAGNRISKTVAATNKTTVYVRDASGNALSVYEQPSSSLVQTEIHLYGSSRLGLASTELNASQIVTSPSTGFYGRLNTYTRGEKIFELSNHLGNVLATVTDKKIQVAVGGSVDYYTADVQSASDYYPFGMQMVARGWQSEKYRYGFNGKEKDNEVSGEGNQYDYGFRIYNPRLGRFLSVDPLTQSYPWYTPYQFAGNMPIWAVDLDGLEELKATKKIKIFAITAAGRTMNEGEAFADEFGGRPVQRVVGTTVVQQGDPGGLEEVLHISIVLGISRTEWMETKVAQAPPPHPGKLPEPEPDTKNNVEKTNEIEDPVPGRVIPPHNPVLTWRQGTKTSVTPVYQSDDLARTLKIDFQYENGSNPGTGFVNKDEALSEIKSYSSFLKANGVSQVDLTVSTQYPDWTSNAKYRNYNKASDLVAARQDVLRSFFAAEGIKTIMHDQYGVKPKVSGNLFHPIQKLVGYTVTTVPVRQKLLDGKPSGSIIPSGKTTSSTSSVKPSAGVTWNK